MIYASLVALGLGAGILSGLFGIGGGIVIVPALVMLLGFSQTAASGTSMCALLLPVGLLGILEYYKLGKIGIEHIRFGFVIAAGMFLGAFLGAKLMSRMPELWLKRGFSILLVTAAAKLWFSK